MDSDGKKFLRITPYETLSILISVLALFLSLASYSRSRAYSAVISVNSLDSLKEFKGSYKTVDLKFSNLSQYASEIHPEVYVEGLSVHSSGGKCPSGAYAHADLPSYVVTPGDSYETTVCVHTLSPRSENASIQIYVNGWRYRSFSYTYSKKRDTYTATSE